MSISFKEPVTARYIYINQETNLVHLIVPIVGGDEISTDNTCKANLAIREFFTGGAAHRALHAYKAALEYDISLLKLGNKMRILKEERLNQINLYIESLPRMQKNYKSKLDKIKKKHSNLYEVQLKPLNQDPASKVVSPTFSVRRNNDSTGKPKSLLCREFYKEFPKLAIPIPDPKTKLKKLVLDSLPYNPDLATIQRVLSEKCSELFNLSIDFTRNGNFIINKESLDELMGFNLSPATPIDYIEALLGMTASEIWNYVPGSLFYSIPVTADVYELTDSLSIMIQFFLANLNVYCRSKKISDENFGKILDNNKALSYEFVQLLINAFNRGEVIEDLVCNFCNTHSEFKFTRDLTPDDIAEIKSKFDRNYRTVTATNDKSHMDDFLFLDKESKDSDAIFVSFQGTMGINAVEMLSSKSLYFEKIQQDFAALPKELSNNNAWIASDVLLEQEELSPPTSLILSNLNAIEFSQLQSIVGGKIEKVRTATTDNYRSLSFTAAECETLKQELSRQQPRFSMKFFSSSPAASINKKIQFEGAINNLKP